ncbi:MAG: DUF3781 domain-containing protein [Clostridiales bacterium]|nr:DUF3781 domain-containing protein [Clostridiales bacterium]
MEEKAVLLRHLDALHTTDRGRERIQKNLRLGGEDPLEFCRRLILRSDCRVTRRGKNWYCEGASVRLTVNASACTVITAHPLAAGK